jgi:replicative DNA helicase
MDNEKLPPYDVEAEEAVIGSLLVDGEAMFEVATFLKAEDFFSPQNKLIYEACYSLYGRNTGINQITVADELARQGKLEEIGGVSCLSQLVATVRLISASSRIATIGYESEPDVEVALSKAEDILFNVKQRRGRGDFVHLKNILGQYFQEVEPVSDQEQIAHILTGFKIIDDVLVGLQRSSLIVLGARTSVGKTSMALNIECCCQPGSLCCNIQSGNVAAGSGTAPLVNRVQCDVKDNSHRELY